MGKKKQAKRFGTAAAVGRRMFLAGVGGTLALAGGKPVLGQDAAVPAAGRLRGPAGDTSRRTAAFRMRQEMARLAFERPQPAQIQNGEERDYPFVANFSKGLPHNFLGEVDPQAYRLFLEAILNGSPESFEAVPLGGERRLGNPLAGQAFDLEGPDSHHLALAPAPRIDSPEGAAEQAELYWMGPARDLHFSEYETSLLIARAADELTRFSTFRGPREGQFVTPRTVFRGMTPGDLSGPYVSQFLLRGVPYGTLDINQQQLTVLPGIDYLTDPFTWRVVQQGDWTGEGDAFDPVRRYIRNGRDLAAYVHFDALYQAYLNACLILLAMDAPVDSGNPYAGLTRMDAFATFGGPHILSLVTEVATRALKAVWYQKWWVHRRLRPEVFGGRIHHHLTGASRYPIHPQVLESEAVQETFARYASYLLPQAYPEGSPLHPSYGAGHATVAGACVTVLKAWFDENSLLPDPQVAGADGLSLEAYTGPEAGALTVGGELNKLAANIALGRNFAGIHYRSDYSESLRLGEEVALGILEEQHDTYGEHGTFAVTRFDGSKVEI